MSDLIIKVCGLKDPKTIQGINNSDADWMGFIFFEKSPRHVLPSLYATIADISDKKKVGVFVNESKEKILSIVEDCQLDMVQLHGQETAEFCEELQAQIPVMKAISVKAKEDVAKANLYDGHVSYLLFDTKKVGQHGGTGEKFNWEVLQDYQGKTPFLLSGGINPDDVLQLKAFQHHLCVGYDINSGFEIEPGRKDISLVSTFITQIQQS